MLSLSWALLGIFACVYYLLFRWNPRKSTLKAVRLLLFLLFALPSLFDLVVVSWWTYYPLAFGKPSDEKIIAMFRDHRTEFEKIKKMVFSDVSNGYLIDFISMRSGDVVVNGGLGHGKSIGFERKKVYEQELDKICPDLNMGVQAQDKVILIWISVGSLTSGPTVWDKGIMYSSGGVDAERKIAEKSRKSGGWAYVDDLKAIESDWCVYYQEF